jgi:hypothetical protein
MSTSFPSENRESSGVPGNAPDIFKGGNALHAVICVPNWWDQKLLESACQAHGIPYTVAVGREDLKAKCAVKSSVAFVHVRELNTIKHLREDPDFPRSPLVFVNPDLKAGAKLIAECGLESVVELAIPYNINDVMTALKSIADGRL